jgi:hypothetical protein
VKKAGTPLNVTVVAPAKPFPVIVTVVPTDPLVGENEVIDGATVTVKIEAPVSTVPPGVVTAIGPLVAPEGTVAVICVSELTVYDAAVPLKVTDVAPVRALPVIVTDVPAGPLVGEKELIEGAGEAVTVKTDGFVVAVPPPVVTAIGPVDAPDGTVAVICVSEFTTYEATAPLNVTDVAPVKAVPVIVTDVPTGPLVGE